MLIFLLFRSCCMCATVLVDAITLESCGHSVCKKCVLRVLSSVCKKCGMAYELFTTDPMDEESNIKLSILGNQQMKEGILSHYGELCGSHSHHNWHIHSQNIIESMTS